MKNDELFNKKICCGCGACAVICPRNAISLIEDLYGFTYPQIDDDKCINCGACKKVCAFRKEKEENKFTCYACANKNENLIMKSASGGAFSAIADSFLKKGGYVCGAVGKVQEGYAIVEHEVISKREELYQLQGSKYVQSATLTSFKKIQQLLKDGEKVLFSGTPCQVDAIKSLCRKYVGVSLFTMDIICHGVPNQKIFNGYLEEYQKRRGSILSYIDFRNKQYGWGLKGVTRFEDETEGAITPENSSYYKMFLDGEIYRESCYYCPYANLNRVGDLTIGDYWGFQDLSPELKDKPYISEKKGVSCLIVNEPAGADLIREYGEGLVVYPVEVEKVMIINTQLREPANHTGKRDKFLQTFSNKGYGVIEKKYQGKLKIKRYKSKIKSIVPGSIKNVLKSVAGK